MVEIKLIIATVEPPSKGQFGANHVVLCWEVVLFSVGPLSKVPFKVDITSVFTYLDLVSTTDIHYMLNVSCDSSGQRGLYE